MKNVGQNLFVSTWKWLNTTNTHFEEFFDQNVEAEGPHKHSNNDFSCQLIAIIVLKG